MCTDIKHPRHVCSLFELPWNLAGYNGMECSGLPMIAYNKGMINIDADDLYRAQITDGVLMTIKPYAGDVDDKKMHMKYCLRNHI